MQEEGKSLNLTGSIILFYAGFLLSYCISLSLSLLLFLFVLSVHLRSPNARKVKLRAEERPSLERSPCGAEASAPCWGALRPWVSKAKAKQADWRGLTVWTRLCSRFQRAVGREASWKKPMKKTCEKNRFNSARNQWKKWKKWKILKNTIVHWVKSTFCGWTFIIPSGRCRERNRFNSC